MNLVGNEWQRRSDQVDLPHPFGLDRIRPLLVGGLLEECRKDIACRARHGIEVADLSEERLQALRIRDICAELPRVAGHGHDLMTLLFQSLLDCGPDRPSADNNNSHYSLLLNKSHSVQF